MNTTDYSYEAVTKLAIAAGQELAQKLGAECDTLATIEETMGIASIILGMKLDESIKRLYLWDQDHGLIEAKKHTHIVFSAYDVLVNPQILMDGFTHIFLLRDSVEDHEEKVLYLMLCVANLKTLGEWRGQCLADPSLLDNGDDDFDF